MTREARFIDKQKLIEAIEASSVDINYISEVYENCCNILKFDTEFKTVIDAHKLLEILKNG